MLISLNNQKALVGGASQGLGLAIARQLAASGASVTLMARNEQKLREATGNLPVTDGQQHQYLVADFSDFPAYQQIIEGYFANNQVEILINNTNGPKAGTVREQTAADYQSAFNLLFQTVQYTTALAARHMKASGYGRIINLTSRTVKEPVDHLALSNTIRAAVVAWGKTLSRELGKYQITVNNILTGNFNTERLQMLFDSQATLQGISPEAVTQQAIADIPLQRLGTPEELARVVTFLASEQAGYLTGASIPVDGGLLKSI